MGPREDLVEEISNASPNINRIRQLCRSTPNLVETTGLRSRIWCLLLLGTDRDMVEQEPWEPSVQTCLEQQVLDADLNRTRAEVPSFRSESWRKVRHMT